MPSADARLHAILLTHQHRHPQLGEVELLRQIDAKIVPCVLGTMDILPITSETIVGLVDMVGAIDKRLNEAGHTHFVSDDRMQKTYVWLQREDLDPDKKIPFLRDKYGALREELWSTVPTR